MHFAPLPRTPAPVKSSLPYWITHDISKVIGGAPAIVFEPWAPIASTTKAFKARKINRGWLKFQAIINGSADHIHGYDDGEAEPQSRGVH